MNDKELIEKAKGLISDLLGMMKVEAIHKISIKEDSDGKKFVDINIEGDDVAQLIGYRGKVLNALQLVFIQMLNNQMEESIPVVVDINNYRGRRIQYLESLAHRAALEAKETGQNVELPPLSAFERRVVHLALQEDDSVETESVGDDQDRHIVVKIK